MKAPVSKMAIAPLCALALFVACSEHAQEAESQATALACNEEVTRWSLSIEPALQIGVTHGDTDYELHRAASTLRLPDGRIVVSNAGTNELRFFDANGRFLMKVGGEGEGPGEFRRLVRLYRFGSDSILALDIGPNNLSVLDLQGNFGRRAIVHFVTADSVFPLDVWMFRQFWVEGALEPTIRDAVKRVLQPLTIPDVEPAYRFVRVTYDGDLWIREPMDSDDSSWRWNVLDSIGCPKAKLETPLGFDLHEIGSDYVLGRWENEDGVNFIRQYTLNKTDDGEDLRLPSWITVRSEIPSTIPPREEEQLIEEMTTALRLVVMAEETFFGDNSTYTESRHLLTWPSWGTPAEDVDLDIIFADSFGWTAVATHRRLRKICGMGIGSGTPPGWLEGDPRCP